MDISNLKMTLKAYQKPFPSVLAKYPTKKELSEVLENYVEEAPVDGKTYARKDEAWTEIRSNVKIIYTGFTNFTGTIGPRVFKHLDKHIVPIEESKLEICYETKEPGVCWFCSTVPIKSIKDSCIGFVIDYVKQESVVDYCEDGETIHLFCYRTATPLVPNTWNFTINI